MKSNNLTAIRLYLETMSGDRPWHIDKGKLCLVFTLTTLVLLFVGYYEWHKTGQGKTEVVFCNVGQGDAAIIKSPKGKVFLIDGGPDERVLECLSKNLPFWKRNIEAVFLTHPQADHLTGLITVLDRYSVDNFFLGPEGNKSAEFDALRNRLIGKNVRNLTTGDKIKSVDGVEFLVLWPTKDFLVRSIEPETGEKTGPAVLGAVTNVDLNRFSLVLRLNSPPVLFMGDADSSIQADILAVNPEFGRTEILKVPHHGSKTALLPEFLNTVEPSYAVISVGKDNRFGHPSSELLGILEATGLKILRTDLDGEQVISN